MKILKKIFGIMMAVLCILSVTELANGLEPGENPYSGIAAAVFCGVIAILMFLPKRNKSNNTLTTESVKTCALTHVYGLPIKENTFCKVTSYDDRFEFTSGTVKFELMKEKITDMRIATETEIEKQYVSSVGGAVGGAVLFGPIGAMIGGRAKKKTVKRETTFYLVITYMTDGEIKYVGFIVSPFGQPMKCAKSFVNEFKNSNVGQSTIQL